MLRKRDDAPPKSRGKRAEYAPMLATLAERRARPAKGWSFEVKFDGYRALAYVRGSEARLVSRNGNDLTARFENVARALSSAIKTPDCVLDGEVCALDEEGRSSFSAMQQGSGAIVYYVVRRARGRGHAGRRPPARGEARGARPPPRPPEPHRPPLGGFRRRRRRCKKAAAEQKSRGHRRQEGRLALRAGPPLAQLAEDQGARPPGVHRRRLHAREGPAVGDARLARPRGQRRETASSTSATSARGSRRRRSTSSSRSSGRSSGRARRSASSRRCRRCASDDIVWVEPRLVCEVEFAEWTHDGRLRAPVLQGPPRGQGGRGGAPRAADRDRDPARQARPQALEPRQDLLPGERAHEGRPARLLPRCRAGARPASEEPAVHDEALSRTGATASSSSRRTRRSTCPNGSTGRRSGRRRGSRGRSG